MAKAETLAKEGQKPTPSVISTKPPMWSTGWKVDVEISPFHRRSATAGRQMAWTFDADSWPEAAAASGAR